MKIELWRGERVLAETSGSMIGGWGNSNWVNVGGLLYVTNRRVIFDPVAFPFQASRTSIPLDEIAAVRPRNSLWFIPDSLEITTRDGVRYRFKVWSRDRIIDLIQGRTEEPPSGPSRPGE
jgi:hypothetical protein